ncbi:unnamed protein product [Cunninghamella echinulata]
MDALLPILPHALQLVRNQRGAVQKTHSQIQSNDITATTATTSIATPPIGTHTCIHHHHLHDNKRKESRTLDLNTPVSHRARTSPFPMITVEEAHHIISQYALPLDTIEKSLSPDLIGYVLAENVRAKESVPAYRASIVDGYAVHAEDGPGIYPVAYISVAKSQHTEGQPFVLKRGEIARVATGGMVPEGANAVVMVEDTKLIETTEDGKEELRVEILVESKEQAMIRPIGSDCKKGDIVCEKGTLITAMGGELGILASVGITHVKVYRKPKIGILSSGNEVKDIHDQQQGLVSLLPGEIRDSNRLSLLAALQQQGMEAIDLGIVKDDVNSMESSLKQALSKVDVIISTGGVSMGEADYMKPLLEQKLNATIHFGRVHMKPGKPTTFATVNSSKLIFALPGNPVSAMVTFYLFVLPALRKMAAFEQYKNVVLPVKLTHDIYLDPRPEYHRVRVYVNNGSLEATSTGNQQSSRMISMLSANGLLKLPKKTNDIIALKKGESVPCLILGSLYQM